VGGGVWGWGYWFMFGLEQMAAGCRLRNDCAPPRLRPPARPPHSNARAAQRRSLFDWLAVVLPCLQWLRTYKIKENLFVRVKRLGWDVALVGETAG